MAIVALVLLIGLGNFALGFGLAVYLGHGPHWAELPPLRKAATGAKSVAAAVPKAKAKH